MNKMIFVWLSVSLALIALVNYLFALAWLKKRQEKISVLFARWHMVRYLDRYRELTRQETGRIGHLFWGFIICINLALLCFILFIVL